MAMLPSSRVRYFLRQTVQGRGDLLVVVPRDQGWRGHADKRTRGKLMNLFEELRAAAVEKSEDGDFPDWLLAEVLAVADSADAYAAQQESVELLIAQVRDYDTYAGAGCFDWSVTAETIKRTLQLIRNG